MTSEKPGVLRNRAALLFALLVCIYEALPASITSLRPGGSNGRDPILIFGLTASIVITLSIATRSAFIGDRIVFGAASAAFILWLIRSIFLFGPFAGSIVSLLVSFIWAVGALACLTLLIRWGQKGPA